MFRVQLNRLYFENTFMYTFNQINIWRPHPPPVLHPRPQPLRRVVAGDAALRAGDAVPQVRQARLGARAAGQDLPGPDRARRALVVGGVRVAGSRPGTPLLRVQYTPAHLR
jgi:hypothetical protein